MKRAIMALLFCLLLSGVSVAEEITSQDIYNKYPSKKIVGVFVDIPQNIVADEKLYKIIIDNLSPQFPGDKYKILPIDDTMSALKSYLAGKGQAQLKKGDMESISQQMGINYAVLIGIKQTTPHMQMILFVATYKTTITCSMKFFKADDFNTALAANKITKEGSSSALTLLGTPDFYGAYADAVRAALSEIKIDISTL